MTFIAGIICADGIVISADSQQTKGSQKRQGAKKISVVEFVNGSVLVAEAGVSCFSQNAVRRFKRMAKRTAIDGEDAVIDLLAKAVREVRNYQKKLYPTVKGTDREWQYFFMEEYNAFELTVAFYADGRPYLYNINLANAMASEPLSFFSTSGIGSELGDFLLTEQAEPDMASEFGTAIAIYITEKVSEANTFCSGNVQVGIARLLPKNLYPDTEPLFTVATLLPAKEVSEIGKIVLELDHQTKPERDRLLKDQIRERTHRIMEQALHPRHPTEDMPLY